MATVYLAEDRKHNRKVAVKVLRPELGATIGPERFLREIQIAAGLDHPHILPLYDSGEAGGFLFYVMPLVEGESLRDRLDRERQLPIDDALQVAEEVADALAYAHSHGVVHRDIKPENILLSGGHARVSDFGVARALYAAGDDRITETGFAVGTPSYMSPEQATGAEDVDNRSDIYSLGCVVYEMLGGAPPFTGATPHAVLARHAIDPVPSLATVRTTIPAGVRLAVERALAKVPADRFPTASGFATALRTQQVAKAPITVSRRWLAVPALVGVLALIAWLAWRYAPASAVDGATTGFPPTRIAVLYFDDHSEGGQLGHVAAGLTEGLIHELAQVDALEVVSRNGVKPYRAASVPIDSIVRALEVGTIVEGSVARSGDRLRVTVQLVDAATDTHLESQVLEEPITDLFALQDRLTSTVSEFLRARIGREIRLRERRAGTGSVDAWELVELADQRRDEARRLRNAGDSLAAVATLAAADSLLARAEGLDSRWIEPIVQRGWVAEERADLWQPVPGSADTVWIAIGVAHANRALRLVPNDPGALELRGSLMGELADGRARVNAPSLRRQAEADLRAAVAGDPERAGAWAALSELMRVEGRFAEAKEAAERALAKDAFLADASGITFNLYQASLDLDQVTEAARWCEIGQRRFAGRSWTAACRLFLGALGEGPRLPPDSAQALYDLLLTWSTPAERGTNEVVGHMWMAAVMAREADRDSAEALVRTARSEASEALQPWVSYLEANVRLLLDDREAALDQLGDFLQAFPQRKSYIASDWMFRPLWSDPRYQALVDTVGEGP
jgi:serine/threonine-protein kinase